MIIIYIEEEMFSFLTQFKKKKKIIAEPAGKSWQELPTHAKWWGSRNLCNLQYL
jgi:hypothetical protein